MVGASNSRHTATLCRDFCFFMAAWMQVRLFLLFVRCAHPMEAWLPHSPPCLAVDTACAAQVGPVIGVVSSTSAVVMVELGGAGDVCCVLTDPVSQHSVQLRRRVLQGRPVSFAMRGLHPKTRYEVRS